jgi:hypothetical protein
MGHFAKGGVQNSYSFPFLATGQFIPGTTAKRLDNIPCEQVYIRAGTSNTGTIYVGGSNVSSAQGMTLAAGEFTPWLPIQNLNMLYAIGTVATDIIKYFIVR